MATEPVSATNVSDVSDTPAINNSSQLRSRLGDLDPRGRAERRVAEYLRAQGLTDEQRALSLAHAIADACEGSVSPTTAYAAAAVTEAQARMRAWRSQLFGDDKIDALWLRAFISAHPDAFLADGELASARVLAFGDPRAGRPPTHAEFSLQAFAPFRAPRWLLGVMFALAVGGTVGLTLATNLSRNGLTIPELIFSTLCTFLFGFGAVGFWTASLGFVSSLRDRRAAAFTDPGKAAPLPRTALIMPIYHESPEHVFAALLGMRESLATLPGGDAFEIFVLSDSRVPERAAEEERAFRRIAALGDPRVPVFYRRRARNDRQKSGNLAEFFERWGHRYQYAVVLDADSLMRGETLIELVRRMEAAPEVALLQAPLTLHGGRTLFARAQQLAASLYGPAFTRGLAAWAGPHGNYYGHNAIVRVRAFLECCALPVLAGEPPLGGHILSHDFVEAALLCRAGWEVRAAHDLTGSWEELPPTLPEYVARDRRWCQGNLQHLRIAFTPGLKPMSRVHMLVGAAAYLASPGWLLFMVSGLVLASTSAQPLVTRPVAYALVLTTLLLLLLPRVLGLLLTLRDPMLRQTHGGTLRCVGSAVLETLFASVIAPILMLHHTRIVLSIFLGRAVRWGSQQRSAKGELAIIVQAELLTTLIGVGSALALAVLAPTWLAWLAPVWLPWLFAIPLALLASSERAGRVSARLGLWTVPSESAPDPLSNRVEELRALTGSDDSARFRDLVLDPILLEAHLARTEATIPSPAPSQAALRLRQRALRMGPAALNADERRLLTADSESMRWLHDEAWRHWPVELWQIGRELPQLPPDVP